ncbi:cell cycle control protein [Amylocystis lapponica]|nr:cell cycle control protein [Amylocystis lapponica]
MAIFRRNKGSSENGEAPKKEKGSWRRPANTAFKQQRLKAWQPILTPKTVLPTLFIIGIVFAPIGGLLIWGSGLVSEMTFDYTQCQNQAASPSATQLNWVNMPSSSYNYKLRSSASSATYTAPQFAFVDSSNDTTIDVSERQQCFIQFDVPIDLDPTVLLYYKLTNFYQNHRRYVNSLDQNQLKGSYVSAKALNSGECSPLATNTDHLIFYPCGLIANSVFNDTFSGLTLVDSSTTYNFSESGIAWPGEAKKYAASPAYNLSEIVPPPNWTLRYPSGYSNSTPPPDLKSDEHFQNWMRTAGLPTFTKLYGRNDDTTLAHGRYMISVNLNFPVLPYSGTKSIVISTVSWIGGKNPFLGWAYIASAALLVFLAVIGTIRHMVRPRKLGDMSLLSWNR